ncbi:right-handed parallel beta-helix repeat-containing protein [Sorangium sp. So ce1036]|uniref:right-handed parallel beta-helix repeat-containing protein n=1 Tax=Sorangium sp. So ce1036 TaxID=3133328 RepID=UPI003F0878E0
MDSSTRRSPRWPLAAAWSWTLTPLIALLGCGNPFDAKSCAPGAVAGVDEGCAPRPCGPGEIPLEAGVCQPAGLPPDMSCPPGQLALDGQCHPAGLPPEACGEGAEGHRRCAEILPATMCPEGKMAIPKERACREVASCGDGPWGEIPVETTTQFVDGAYEGDDSDGTATRPWTTIQRAIDEAQDGAIVAVATGSYTEDVVIRDKAVRLWGRCPGRVTIHGTGQRPAAVQVLRKVASRTEIRSLAVTGTGKGLSVGGARDVTIEQVWVHGSSELGVEVRGEPGSTSALLKGSLVEQNHDTGVLVQGSEATLEGTVIRATRPGAEGRGRGIEIESDPDTGTHANVSVRASVIEQNQDYGMFISGSDASIEDSVVRGTQPGADRTAGRGIEVQGWPGTGARASLTVHASVIEQNHEAGVFVSGADATIKASVVRNTEPGSDGMAGRGIEAQGRPETGERASLTVHASVVEQNQEVGVLVSGADATIEASVVRGTRPNSKDEFGRGLGIQYDRDTGPARATVRASVIEQNLEAGVFVAGAEAMIEDSVIRYTRPGSAGASGRGIEVRPESHERGSLIVRSCLLEQNHGEGVFVAGAEATIEASVVRDTQPGPDGMGGRGINAQSVPGTGERADVTVRASLIERNHELGVYVSGSDATLEASVVRDTRPRPDGRGGAGIGVRGEPRADGRSSVTVRDCLVERNHESGVLVSGSSATIEGSVVRGTRPSRDGTGGRGISAQDELGTGERASVTVRDCLIEENHEAGVFAIASDATLEATVVRATRTRDDHKFGDGIVVEEGGTATLLDTTITGNDGAGVANFASTVSFFDATLTCNAVPLHGERIANVPASFHRSGRWLCSRRGAEDCTETDEHCRVTSFGVEPPPRIAEPPSPGEPLPPLPLPSSE